jgi:hypothetical protein
MMAKMISEGKSTVRELINELERGNKNANIALMPLKARYKNLFEHLRRNNIDSGFRLTDKTQELDINTKLTAKIIRSCIMALRYNTHDPIVIQKSYFVTDVKEANIMVLLSNIRNITSVYHKNTFLRILNGDILCNSKLYKMGLTDTSKCKRCGQEEDREHLLIECDEIKAMWESFFKIAETVTGKKREVCLENVLCIGKHPLNTSILILTIELLSKIVSAKRMIPTQKLMLSLIAGIVEKESRNLDTKKGKQWIKWKNAISAKLI